MRLRHQQGGWVNNVDVTQQALNPLPLAQYALHQGADGSLTLNRQTTPDKVRPYRSDWPGASDPGFT